MYLEKVQKSMENSVIHWLTVRQASELVNVTEKTVRTWLKNNLIHGEFSPGLKRWRINKVSLLQYVEYRNENNQRNFHTH